MVWEYGYLRYVQFVRENDLGNSTPVTWQNYLLSIGCTTSQLQLNHAQNGYYPRDFFWTKKFKKIDPEQIDALGAGLIADCQW